VPTTTQLRMHSQSRLERRQITLCYHRSYCLLLLHKREREFCYYTNQSSNFFPILLTNDNKFWEAIFFLFSSTAWSGQFESFFFTPSAAADSLAGLKVLHRFPNGLASLNVFSPASTVYPDFFPHSK